MKFSVGDKVRLTEEGAEFLRIWTGSANVGDVCEVIGASNDTYRLRLPNGDSRWHACEYHVEAVEPRFKVGDRVKVVQASKSWKKRFIGKTLVVDGIDNDSVWGDEKPYLVHGDSDGDSTYVWFDDELAPAPHAPRHVFAASQASHIDDETIDRWVDEGVKNVEAQKTLNFENPSFTTKSGDALVVVENGKAYLYRLEGEKNV